MSHPDRREHERTRPGIHRRTVVDMAAFRSSPNKRVLLVMPYHQLTRKAAEAGFHVWSLWDPELPEADLLDRVEHASEGLLLTGFGDEAGLRRLVERTAYRHGIGAVVHCGSGASVLPVVEEAWRLGLSPNPPSAIAGLRARREPASVGGPRLTVQTLTVDGAHRVVGVAVQRTSGPPDHRVTGHLFPAPLSDSERAGAENAVLELLRGSGYRFGPASAEVQLTEDGPRVLCCVPRFGPDRLPLLAQAASGFDVEAALFAALLGDEVPGAQPAQRYAEIGFFALPEGQLLTYTGTEDIAVTPWVRGARFPYRPGDRIPPPADPRTRRAYVLVVGGSPEETQERIRRARGDLVTDIRGVADGTRG